MEFHLFQNQNSIFFSKLTYRLIYTVIEYVIHINCLSGERFDKKTSILSNSLRLLTLLRKKYWLSI